MKSIVLLGTGNLASHLFTAINKTPGFQIIQVYNHNYRSLESFSQIPVTTQFDEILKADIYLISIKDDQISRVSENLESNGSLVIHTAGGKPMEILNSHERTGVFYPLQTFSKNKKMNFQDIPICLEATSESDLQILEELAGELRAKVYRIDSAQRKSLHVAAVFVSNFVNYLYTEGEQICRANQIPFEILLPLIKETAHKAGIMSPYDAQTGPALRNDKQVIEGHLAQLTTQQKEIYTLLTHSIQNLHGKEL